MKLLGFKSWLLYLKVEIELTRTAFFRLFSFQGSEMNLESEVAKMSYEKSSAKAYRFRFNFSALLLRVCTLTTA